MIVCHLRAVLGFLVVAAAWAPSEAAGVGPSLVSGRMAGGMTGAVIGLPPIGT